VFVPFQIFSYNMYKKDAVLNVFEAFSIVSFCAAVCL